ncbi:MAG: spore maturation protein [Ruminococcaceae bacterium]|nr:spore maturation protein [Oscillospiraceae bacterium]
MFSKRDRFESFLAGARQGLGTAVNLLPTLCALIVGVAMLNASGAIEWLANLFSPIASAIGVPAELLPLLFTRPFSGSASTASFVELLERVGADSFAGLCASVIFATSDTMVYIISVYFSSVGIKHSRAAFPIAGAVMLFCIFFSCFLCRMWFF